jgi:Reverse transcriptase (RNA-dependent DNA polymerase)
MLLNIGCKSLNNDPSIYIYREKTVIIAHINNILIFSQNIENINKIREKLASKLELSNLGEARYFLGIEIIRNRQNKRLVLSQRQFIEQIMQKFNKNALKLIENLLTKGICLEQNLEKASETDIKAY